MSEQKCKKCGQIPTRETAKSCKECKERFEEADLSQVEKGVNMGAITGNMLKEQEK